MKYQNNIKTFLLILIISFIGIQAQGQQPKKDKNKMVTFEVKGNCGMCKSRIEKAVTQIKGVKFVNWDVVSKNLTVVHDERKCSVLDIKEAIGKVGHDTDAVKAMDDIYNNLPACCKFRDPESLLLEHH